MTLSCPTCGSHAFKKNGYTRHGKQNHRCLDCGRQFSHEPEITIPNTKDNTVTSEPQLIVEFLES